MLNRENWLQLNNKYTTAISLKQCDPRMLLLLLLNLLTFMKIQCNLWHTYKMYCNMSLLFLVWQYATWKEAPFSGLSQNLSFSTMVSKWWRDTARSRRIVEQLQEWFTFHPLLPLCLDRLQHKSFFSFKSKLCVRWVNNVWFSVKVYCFWENPQEDPIDELNIDSLCFIMQNARIGVWPWSWKMTR